MVNEDSEQIEQENEEICELLNNAGLANQEENNQEPEMEFRALKKPLDRDSLLDFPEKGKEKEEQQVQLIEECPRKKVQKKDPKIPKRD